MNGPEENSSLYLPRISVFHEVKPTLIKLSKVIVKTQEHAWVIFLKISGRLCYCLLRASRAFTEMENVLTDLSRHKKLPKNLLVYLKLALLGYVHEKNSRLNFLWSKKILSLLYDKHFIQTFPSRKHTQNRTQLCLYWQESARYNNNNNNSIYLNTIKNSAKADVVVYFAVHFAVAGSKGVFE